MIVKKHKTKKQSLIILRGLFQSSNATASHILLDKQQDAEKYKKEISNDLAKFAQYAQKYSTCPSGKNGSPPGSLGNFKGGEMVPPFDRAVFDTDNKVDEVIGPIQTQYGWHLILIQERLC